jgi:hypothetical protein
MQTGIAIAIAVATLVLGAAVTFFVLKASAKKKVGNAKDDAEKIVNEAKAEAERVKAQGKEESKRALKEALLEAKEQDLKLRNEFERETKEKKAEIQRMEQRLTQKEDALDKKTELLEQQKAHLFKFLNHKFMLGAKLVLQKTYFFFLFKQMTLLLFQKFRFFVKRIFFLRNSLFHSLNFRTFFFRFTLELVS